MFVLRGITFIWAMLYNSTPRLYGQSGWITMTSAAAKVSRIEQWKALLTFGIAFICIGSLFLLLSTLPIPPGLKVSLFIVGTIGLLAGLSFAATNGFLIYRERRKGLETHYP